MTELPDDELDKLFRKSMNELNPNFEQDNWNALSKRLDDANRKTDLHRIFKWPLLRIFTVLVIIGALYYSYSDEKRDPPKPAKVSANSLASSKADKKDPKTNKGFQKSNNAISRNSKLVTKDTLVSRSVRRSDIDAADILAAESKVIDSNVPGENFTVPIPSVAKKRLLHNLQPKPLIKLAYNQKPIVQQVEAVTIYTANQDLPKTDQPKMGISVNDTVFTIQNQERPKPSIPISIIDNHLSISNVRLNFPSIEHPKSEEFEQEAGPAPTSQFVNRLAFYFGYSPDLSAVKIKNLAKPGFAVFLMAEYSISNRMYFQLGLARSKKIYNAQAGEYTWPSNWKQKILPTSVDGTCKMLEIPFNLRFDITQKKLSRWFVTAGVSSYYMANEKYVYNYPPYSTNIKWYDYQVKTGWYLLSHANVSVGYQYRLSKKLFLIAEPYARIPVKKVGYGKINLTTTGVWLSVRYIPVFN
ncbi:porin family protein [Dyadobacter luticola]|jgi:hypothetical protein|uniref:Porin family protein n=1 Tax=Dyadobacter luticola TaxID=1979387 RepID=A0A5R9KMJ8_9BACT|nr:porin family protein [Dyadobacter luticola]TLU97349.1 porin family protein [Dyadobacter luticola]